MIRFALAISLAVVPLAAQTLAKEVEKAAYLAGRCSAHLTAAEKGEAVQKLEGRGYLLTKYNEGLVASQRQPVSAIQCEQAILQSRLALEKYFQGTGR